MRELGGCDPDIIEAAPRPRTRASLRGKVQAAYYEEAEDLIKALNKAKGLTEVLALAPRVNGLRVGVNSHGEALGQEFTEVLAKIEELNLLVEGKLVEFEALSVLDVTSPNQEAA